MLGICSSVIKINVDSTQGGHNSGSALNSDISANYTLHILGIASDYKSREQVI
jgi:hypothetical protein